MSDDDGCERRIAQSIAKKLKAQSSNTRSLRPFKLKARLIAQSIHPYMDLTKVFLAGTPEAVAEEDQPFEFDEAELDAFNAIMLLARGFRKVVQACAEDQTAFSELINVLTNASSSSRNDDVSSLKSNIIGYMRSQPDQPSHLSFDFDFTPLQPASKKDQRGWNHIETADLLCPLRLKSAFNEDPDEFISQVLENNIMITADDLPSFLYPDETEYNARKLCDGLFRGHLLIRVFRHIFTAPSSALEPHQKVNKSKARLFKLTSTTPRMIAYTAVQTYIALSDKKGWCSTAGGFNLVEFYEGIVDIFETNKRTKWALETLEWFNDQTPGLRPLHAKSKRKATDGSAPPRSGPTLAQRIANQLGLDDAPPAARSASVQQHRQPSPAQPRLRPAAPPPLPPHERENHHRSTPLRAPKPTSQANLPRIEPPAADQIDDSANGNDDDMDDEPRPRVASGRSKRSQTIFDSDDEDAMDIYEDDKPAVARPSTDTGRIVVTPSPTREQPRRSKKPGPSSHRSVPPPSSRPVTRSTLKKRMPNTEEDGSGSEDDLPLSKRNKRS